jgi:hypothetical protein
MASLPDGGVAFIGSAERIQSMDVMYPPKGKKSEEAIPIAKTLPTEQKKSRPLFSWITLLLCTILLLAVIGLGLGLGIKLQQEKSAVARLRNVEPTIGPSNSNFNYSSYYGIPDVLPIVDEGSLVNTTELDLQTNFTTSNKTTTRTYTFNITQALAAPDGKRSGERLGYGLIW